MNPYLKDVLALVNGDQSALRDRSSLKLSHQTFLLDIYPAGEAPIEGITSQKLAEEFGFQFIGSLSAAAVALSSYLKPGDLLITLGAGSITQLGPMLLGKGHEH